MNHLCRVLRVENLSLSLVLILSFLLKDLCPDNESEFPQRNARDDNSRNYDELYEADRFQDLMEPNENYPVNKLMFVCEHFVNLTFS